MKFFCYTWGSNGMNHSFQKMKQIAYRVLYTMVFSQLQNNHGGILLLSTCNYRYRNTWSYNGVFEMVFLNGQLNNMLIQYICTPIGLLTIGVWMFGAIQIKKAVDFWIKQPNHSMIQNQEQAMIQLCSLHRRTLWGMKRKRLPGNND